MMRFSARHCSPPRLGIVRRLLMPSCAWPVLLTMVRFYVFAAIDGLQGNGLDSVAWLEAEWMGRGEPTCPRTDPSGLI